jgi:hypothetical protein
MNNRYLVGECLTLTPRDVGKRWDRIRKLGVNQLAHHPGISYWFDDMGDPSRLFISVQGHEPQSFAWELIRLTFGDAAYFYCPCGHRASKLYLLPNGNEFKCRKCHKLQYHLSTFNRQSVAGRSLYRANRLQKLANSRASMGRILYNGEYTKRFQRFLGLCDRAGYDSIVQGAKDLKTLIAQ